LANKAVWQIPSGSIDSGKSPIDGARHECLEETGFRCPEIELLMNFRPGLDTAENVMYRLYSEKLEQHRNVVATPDEVLDIAWVPPEECLAASAPPQS